MKKLVLILAVLPLLFSACKKVASPKLTIDGASARDTYGKTVTVTPMDDSVTITRHSITIAPSEENVTYTISGYFNGQIVTAKKNTIIRLKNAFLENTSGKPAIKCKAKAEISTVNGSTSYILSRGRGFAKNAAVLGEGVLVFGGSGTLYVQGKICHGIEGEDVKIKGSGKLYVQGTKRGSALCCDNLTVEPDKTFSAYFLNAKNGIKADERIIISSGNFYLFNNAVAMKTELLSDTPNKAHGITLRGGIFHTYKNEILYVTEKNAYSANGATFIEEK